MILTETHIQDDLFLEAVHEEAKRARSKFPMPNANVIALVEEVGEVAKAILEGEASEELRKECVQVAVMAMRIAVEGPGV